MALLFTVLLAFSAFILGYFLVNLGGYDIRATPEFLETYGLFKAFIFVIFFLMLIVVIVSFGISYFVVSRINRIADTAQNIIYTGDLSQRLEIDSRWDDISNLSIVLNSFLDKIETSMHSAREISNSIAHDLRTPLASLRNDIDSMRGSPASEEAIDALLSDADRILAIFNSLLRIANIEKAQRYETLDLVDLKTIVQDVVELYEPVAEEKSIILSTQMENAHIKGDGDLLFQLFANILDNAIKFSPTSSGVKINVLSEKSGARVVIQDQGPGVPEKDIENVFRHFFRGDASRTTLGNGLGLSLAQAISERLKALLRLENTYPGLRIEIVFPPYQ